MTPSNVNGINQEAVFGKWWNSFSNSIRPLCLCGEPAVHIQWSESPTSTVITPYPNTDNGVAKCDRKNNEVLHKHQSMNTSAAASLYSVGTWCCFVARLSHCLRSTLAVIRHPGCLSGNSVCLGKKSKVIAILSEEWFLLVDKELFHCFSWGTHWGTESPAPQWLHASILLSVFPPDSTVLKAKASS